MSPQIQIHLLKFYPIVIVFISGSFEEVISVRGDHVSDGVITALMV